MYNTLINAGLVLSIVAILFPIVTLVLAPNLFENEMILGMLFATVYILFAGLDKGW